MTDAYDRPPTASDIAVGDTGPEVVVENLQRKDFVQYAGASGDFNPIHYDEPYAKQQGNPSVFGQGMLTAGIAAHMLADWFGVAHIQQFRTRFTARVWPEDTVTATGEVVEIRENDGDVVVDVDFKVTSDEDVDVVTGSATATLPPDDEGQTY